MSRSMRRPNREQIGEQKKARRQAMNALREKQRVSGLRLSSVVSMPNRKCEYQSVEEEQAARMTAVSEQVKVMRAKLPRLLERLAKIQDPRDPKKLEHKLTVVMLYGILTFIFQMAFRREANREMTRPMFMENLKILFPELESFPHNDTLYRQ